MLSRNNRFRRAKLVKECYIIYIFIGINLLYEFLYGSVERIEKWVN